VKVFIKASLVIVVLVLAVASFGGAYAEDNVDKFQRKHFNSKHKTVSKSSKDSKSVAASKETPAARVSEPSSAALGK